MFIFFHSETEVHELSEADKQLVSKRNKNPFLIERKQVDKRIVQNLVIIQYNERFTSNSTKPVISDCEHQRDLILP